MRDAHRHGLAGPRLPGLGEGGVDVAIELARRVVGDVEELRLRPRSARCRRARRRRREGRGRAPDQAQRKRAAEEVAKALAARAPVLTRAAENETNSGGVERLLVDENEAAGLPAQEVGVEGERAVEGEGHVSDVVRRDARRGHGRGAVGIDPVAHSLDARAGRRGPEFDLDLVACRERALTAPEQPRLDAGACVRCRVGARDHVPARDVDLVGEDERDRLPGDRALELAVEGDDAGDRRLGAGGRGDDAIADRNATARDQAGIAAEAGIGPVRPLHRHPERAGARALLRGRSLEVPKEGRPAYHGAATAGSTTLSPFSAESGTPATLARPSSAAKARYSAMIAS